MGISVHGLPMVFGSSWVRHLSPALTVPLNVLPLVERRRRFNINDRIKELGMLIPKANDL